MTGSTRVRYGGRSETHGPGKPITVHCERAERNTPLDPLPLSWWDYPRASLRLLPPGGQQEAYSYLRDLAGAHLAGVPNRPSAPRLASMFRSDRLSAADRDILAQLFAGLPSALQGAPYARRHFALRDGPRGARHRKPAQRLRPLAPQVRHSAGDSLLTLVLDGGKQDDRRR